ncbi:hypothetical protein SLT36_17020 [Aminobacter sp. BA135]|uniref:hypothetical protein n=1 Tax=Aminobacter sp. BA135 TaxID=537596 RepID=UPI003D79A968
MLLALFVFAAAGDSGSTGLPMREALRAELARMQEIGGAKIGDQAMVDALSPRSRGFRPSLAAAASAARKGANFTTTRPAPRPAAPPGRSKGTSIQPRRLCASAMMRRGRGHSRSWLCFSFGSGAQRQAVSWTCLEYRHVQSGNAESDTKRNNCSRCIFRIL